jgi:uncharacterized small protein (TIGR04563 family)
MATTDKLKQSLYFPEDTLREIVREANRLDRSLSWTVQQAWRIAREELRRFPSTVRGAERVEATPPLRAATERRDDGERPPSSQVREFLRGKFDRELN